MSYETETRAPKTRSGATTAAASDSDLAQAAAGLLSVRQSAPPIFPSGLTNADRSPANEGAALKSSVVCEQPNRVASTRLLPSTTDRAAGLRSLQAVESILRSQQSMIIPAHPLAGNGGMFTVEDQQAWKRARSCVYTARNRAKKVEQMKVLEEGIQFFKTELGIPIEPKVEEQEDTKKASKLKGVKRNVYLPPEEELKKMSDEEISEWKRKERLKRKRDANAAAAKQQQEKMLQLAIEHEVLHEQYKAKCKDSDKYNQLLGGQKATR
ncbi:hypothetical protein HJC23_013989 [Cyclotella cryptica]|uniref:Uncharacterized protein n=1 Tax=Cyclotella cryptica TaxID=29204 RepID=A0ABD3NYC5_9STRA